MSLTYLQLCQRAAIECDISGPGPTTVVGNVGELNRICGWVAAALNDIETAHTDWGWMLKDASFQTVAGQAEYTPAQCGITALAWEFGEWVPWRFRNYVTTVGVISEVMMDSDCTYDSWRTSYALGATRFVETRPLVVAIHPNRENLCLGPFPAALYTVTGQYFRAPQILVADGDIPDMPTQFQMAIVFKAMMRYGAYESAPEVYNNGEMEFKKMMTRMDASRLPQVRFA